MPNISNVAVASGTGLSTSRNGERKLVRLNNGWLISGVFDSSSKQIKLYKSTNNGSTWSQLCYLQDATTYAISAFSITSKGNTLYVITPRFNGSSTSSMHFYKIDAITQSNVQATKTSDIDVFQNDFLGTSLTINEAGTELHAAWSSKNDTYQNSFNIRYAKGAINPDGSVTWGAVEQVTKMSNGIYEARNPSVVIDGNGVVSIFYEAFGHRYNTGGANTTSTGSSHNSIAVLKRNNSLPSKDTVFINSPTWSAQNVHTGNSHQQSAPSCLFVPQSINGLANGRLWVGWHGKDATDSAKFNIRASYSDDGGSTWSTSVKLTSGNTFDRLNVTLSADKTGKVFALYEDHQWSPDIGIRMKTFSNGSWGTETSVATADTAEQHPSALVDFTIQMTTPPFVYTDTTLGIRFTGNFNVGASVSPASGALGNKETPSLTAYTVTPEAGSTVTQIVERINGVIVNTFNNPASLSRTLTAPNATWDTLAYFATHTASVTVTDSNGAQTVTTYSFAKTLATGASLLEATKANADAKNRMRSQLDVIGSRVGVANGSNTNQIISAIDARNVVKRQNGTATVSSGQITVNTLGFIPKTVTIRSSATQNGTYSELLGTNESRNGTTITQNAFTNITATGFTAVISGTTVTWEAQG